MSMHINFRFSDYMEFIPGLSGATTALIMTSAGWLIVLIVVILIMRYNFKKKKSVDVSALAALASSEPMADDTTANADPKEVMSILSIERVAASTALSAVKDARKSKRIRKPRGLMEDFIRS